MTRPEPFVGMPATINLYSDSMAAVVTKVNKKSILVARVAVSDESRRINTEGEPLPCIAREGKLDEIIGTPTRYARIDLEDGPRFADGSISVTLGKSVSVTDYRY